VTNAIDDHQSNDVHVANQPPQIHDNASHSEDYITSADVDSGVTSFEGRTGDVTGQSGDYSHSQLSGVGSSDHHSRYDDTEAVGAIESKGLLFDADSDILSGTRDFKFNGVAEMDEIFLERLDLHAGSSTKQVSFDGNASNGNTGFTVGEITNTAHALSFDATSGDLTIEGSLTENTSL
jgi:hypothetical protein